MIMGVDWHLVRCVKRYVVLWWWMCTVTTNPGVIDSKCWIGDRIAIFHVASIGDIFVGGICLNPLAHCTSGGFSVDLLIDGLLSSLYDYLVAIET